MNYKTFIYLFIYLFFSYKNEWKEHISSINRSTKVFVFYNNKRLIQIDNVHVNKILFT